jgi:dienelactone hydrolase
MIAWLRCLISVLLLGGPGVSFAEVAVPTGENLASLVVQYLDTHDSDKADRLLMAIRADPYASIEAVTRILQTERIYQSQPVGTLPDEQIGIRGRDYLLSLLIPQTYQPTKRYGLVVCLHGFGFTGEEYLERWRARLGDDYLLACPTYPSGAWFTRSAEELVLASIQHVRRRYHIDSDRIFLTGMSNGGIGAWLIGMHHAPLFAGVAPMASGLDSVLMPFLANLRNTPVYIIHGAKDQVMPVALSRSLDQELTKLGYAHVYREHQHEHPMAGGHYFPREELPGLVAWFTSRHRESLPTRLTLVRDASHFQSFNWVRLDATDAIAAFSDDLVDKRDERITRREYATLDATITEKNRIEVKTERVQRYSLFLNDRLVDMTMPLTVVTNGVLSFEGIVTPSVETLLRQARIRQDPHRLFPVALSITVRPQSP